MPRVIVSLAVGRGGGVTFLMRSRISAARAKSSARMHSERSASSLIRGEDALILSMRLEMSCGFLTNLFPKNDQILEWGGENPLDM